MWLAIALGASTILYLTAVLAVPAIRRWIRRADRDRRRQVLAAWHDTLDVLTAVRTATVGQLSRLTPREVSRLVGGPAMAEAAELAAAALERGQAPDRHEVRRARQASQAARRHVARKAGWRRRILAGLAPGNLRLRSPWRRPPGEHGD